MKTMYIGKKMRKFPITLVPNMVMATENVHSYTMALASGKHESLRKLIPYVQSWYVDGTRGDYTFAPSKYIGYANMTPEIYEAETGANGRLDGRVTEKALAPFVALVTEEDEFYEDLHSALADF